MATGIPGELRTLSYAFRDGRARQLQVKMVATSAFTAFYPKDKSVTGSDEWIGRHDVESSRFSTAPIIWTDCTFRPPPPQIDRVLPLARIGGTTPDDLIKKFQTLFGYTPFEFVQMTRIDAAKIMLGSTKSPIKCIAGAVGFASRSHFSREFSRITGQDPTSFRKRRRSGESATVQSYALKLVAAAE